MVANVLRRSFAGARGVFRLSRSSQTLLRTQNQLAWASSGGFSSDASVETHFFDEESKRRLFNRLLYRSRQRGFLELDLVLGRWVEEHIHSMDVDGVKALISVLDLENPDLWKWLTDQEQPPEPVKMNPVFSAVREKVMKNLSNSAPETRAVPGKPWVRGWDDFKKGPGLMFPIGPIVSSDLGLTPNNVGEVIRLSLPQLTSDRRKKMSGVVAKQIEGGKVALRNVRRDALKAYEKLENEKQLSKEDVKDLSSDLQELSTV